MKTGRVCADIPAPGDIGSLAFSPDGRQFFSGHASGLLAVSAFDPDAGTLTNTRAFQLGKGSMTATIVAAGGQVLVTADQESAVVQAWPAGPFASSRQDRSFPSRLLAISSDRDFVCTLDSRGMPQLVSFPDSTTLGLLQASAAGPIQRAMFLPRR